VNNTPPLALRAQFRQWLQLQYPFDPGYQFDP